MSATTYNQAFFDSQSGGSLTSAHIVLAVLFERIPARSVIDIGCGVGPWLKAALELGADRVIGVDGDYVDRKHLLIDPARFRACDLERNNLRTAVGEGDRFDLALCMEVAEHLTAGRARSFVAELCTFSDLVLFSAAIPGQGGRHHVNEQWPEYWARLFAESEFACLDVLRPLLWERHDCEFWYVQNALRCVKRDTPAFTLANALAPPLTAPPMALVHPRKLAQAVTLYSERITELEHLLRVQLGRDHGIRLLEAKVDRLLTMVQQCQDELTAARTAEQALRSELAALRSECDRLMTADAAFQSSTSWRITAPLRWIAAAVRRE